MTRPPTDAEFTEMVHGCWGSLYRTAYLLVGDHGLAEDVERDTLTTCDAASGECTEAQATVEVPKNALPRIGGMVYES